MFEAVAPGAHYTSPYATASLNEIGQINLLHLALDQGDDISKAVPVHNLAGPSEVV